VYTKRDRERERRRIRRRRRRRCKFPRMSRNPTRDRSRLMTQLLLLLIEDGLGLID
jgi:hypothetical protein